MKPELFSAIIAASAALLGVMILQVFSLLHKASERRHEQRVFLRQKFEEMAIHILNSFGWVNQLAKCSTLAETQSVAVSQDAQVAIVLSKLYFPEIVEVLERYVLVQIAYYEAAIETFRGASQPISLEPFLKSSDALNAEMFAARNEVIRCIKVQAARYGNAG